MRPELLHAKMHGALVPTPGLDLETDHLGAPDPVCEAEEKPSMERWSISPVSTLRKPCRPDEQLDLRGNLMHISYAFRQESPSPNPGFDQSVFVHGLAGE
jgi:hypothetical protein